MITQEVVIAEAWAAQVTERGELVLWDGEAKTIAAFAAGSWAFCHSTPTGDRKR